MKDFIKGFAKGYFGAMACELVLPGLGAGIYSIVTTVKAMKTITSGAYDQYL